MRALQKLSTVWAMTGYFLFAGVSLQGVPFGDPSIKSLSASANTLINTQGTLVSGDAILDDGSLYDQYTFSGSDGQYLTISLDSSDFDPYLILLDPSGRRISENDDVSRGNRNSLLVLTLPATGMYTAVANSYESGKGGQYAIKIDVANTRNTITETLATAAVPNGTPDCAAVIASAVETIETERDIRAIVSPLQLGQLYDTTPSVRPDGVHVSLSGPAAISVIFSPQLLNQLSAQLVSTCASVGATIFSAEAGGFERTFGFLPDSSSPSAQVSRGAAAAALVDEFSCVEETTQGLLAWGTRLCS